MPSLRGLPHIRSCRSGSDNIGSRAVTVEIIFSARSTESKQTHDAMLCKSSFFFSLFFATLKSLRDNRGGKPDSVAILLLDRSSTSSLAKASRFSIFVIRFLDRYSESNCSRLSRFSILRMALLSR